MQASAGKVVRLHSFETIYEDLAGGAARGCTGRGVGGRASAGKVVRLHSFETIYEDFSK